MKTSQEILHEIDHLIKIISEDEGRLTNHRAVASMLFDLKQFILSAPEKVCDHDFQVYRTDDLPFVGCNKCGEIMGYERVDNGNS